MPTSSALRSPAVQNLIAAAAAGAGVMLTPARFPRWARRGLRVANIAGTAGSMLMGPRANSEGGKLGLAPTKTATGTTASSTSALAAAAGGLSLISSGVGVKADEKVELFLRRKGVQHPRILMAVGAIAVVWIAKTVQDAATKKAEQAAKGLATKKASTPPAGSEVRPAEQPTVTTDTLRNQDEFSANVPTVQTQLGQVDGSATDQAQGGKHRAGE
ncbi:hypothetical protein G9U51_06780 [Calidifontibacter sp. DB0510]|uniref:Uncharacterized protein n=1 Tax=Metallococcus carri TaxID=1656884 RepID=A0A967E9R0_9MICO|nr:hypothetical protein [Metallococcus carri]NHN55485.1 hypothetical protein [Metallococcus carri]NOP38331.1 hypothetical protein [Calidifontibacter sp. DB2511S]